MWLSQMVCSFLLPSPGTGNTGRLSVEMKCNSRAFSPPIDVSEKEWLKIDGQRRIFGGGDVMLARYWHCYQIAGVDRDVKRRQVSVASGRQ
jgi:hypothetical protein